MAWQDDAFQLKTAGFSDEEIAAEGQRQRDELAAGGFTPEEIDAHFGVKEPDLSPIKNLLQANLSMRAEEFKKLAEEGKQVPEIADGFLDALDAGFDQSSGVMVAKALQGKRVTPDMVLPEDAPTFYRFASQVGTIAGDLPAMIGGSLAAGVAAAPLTPAGQLVAAGAGGNALPTALRQVLMEYYEKGEIQDFKDFWERTSSVFLNTVKDGFIGGATAGVGGKVLSSASKVAAPAAARVASVGSEIATMVTLGKSFEGEVPNAQDFMDAALLVGGLNVGVKTASKLRQIYAKTGQHPANVVQEAQINPVLKQDLLINSDEMPSLYDEPVTSIESGTVKINGMEPAQIDNAQPEVPAKPSVASEPQTAQEKIISKISTKESKPKESYTYQDFYSDFVDRLDPIKRVVNELAKGGEVDTLQNAYELSRMASDAPAKALHFLGHPENPTGGGVLDFKTLKKVGPSLQEVLSPVKDDIRGFEAYIVSKRAIELEGRGIKSGFDTEAAQTVVKEGKSKFDQAAKNLVEFQNGALKYLKDSGVLSEKSFKNIVEVSKAYVSFKRISDEGTVNGGSKKNPIQKIKGSDLSIQDPLLSLTENTEFIIKLAETNRAKSALVDQALSVEGQELIKKVDTKMRPVEVSSKELAKALDSQGIDAEAAEAFTIFRKQDRPLAKNEFEVYRNGKREVYETTPEVATAIKVLDGNPTSQNIVLKLARGITTVKRLGISLAPDFILRNFTRDQITSSVFTKAGSINPKDVIVAMGDIWKKNDSYYNWLKAGGANGAFLKLQDSYFKENIFKLDEQTGFLDKTWNIVKKPKQFVEMAATLAEQSTRLAEAKRVMNGATEGADVFRAGMASREITIDFQRMGAKVAAANSITAFMNAQIQGLDRTARALKTDPVGVATKASMMITAPSVLLWWANKDDERFKELPQWQKDLFWIIPTDSWQEEQVPGEASNLPAHLIREGKNGRMEINKGVIFRIPKPQELGIMFGSLPERVLENFFTDNPDAFKNFEDTMMGMVTPSMIPDAVTPVAEQYFNKSFFTGNKIVPNHLEGILPQYQYIDSTTESGKMLGRLMSAVPFMGDAGPKNDPLASPMVLENYVRSWSGSLGMYALQLGDQALKATGVVDRKFEKPAWAVADIPFVKAFVVKYPSSQADSIRSFYESFEENEKVLNTTKHLAKQGDVDEATKVMFDEGNQEKIIDLSGVKDALSNQGQMIQMIYRNPEMTADEKRQQIDWLYYGMIETAKMGKQMNNDFKAELQKQKEVMGEH